MARFAKVQVDISTVIDVIMAEQSYVDALYDADNSFTYVESDTLGVGFVYNSGASAYLRSKPHASWVLSDTTIGSVREWEAPIARPNASAYWDETKTAWVYWDEESESWLEQA
tara:strand:+ start:947 stop:1285 length:339 start_codon:yes stop_codon:yes gene_type:complete